LPGGRDVELVRDGADAVVGRIVRERWPIAGIVRVSTRAQGSVVKLRVRIENESASAPVSAAGTGNHGRALRCALLGTHTLIASHDGRFVSLLDPPEWARASAAACDNQGTWPVLVGDPARRDVVLSSPIILYDHPTVAPESPGDLYDATEI